MSMTQDIEASLKALAPALLEGGEAIEGLKRLSGGASQETWAFAVTGDGHSRPLILRRAPGGGGGEARNSNAIGLPTEARLIEAAVAAGLPAPGIAHVCKPADGLGDAFIMDRVEGETIARKILRDEEYGAARPKLAADCGRALAGIHGIDTKTLPELPESFGTDQIDRYEEIYRSFDAPRPIFELAIQWLRANAPRPLAPVLVHGDFRLGNLMIDSGGLAAVLDWELAHIGDPREDIAWACINSWRFGVADKRVGGFGDLPDLLAAYAASGGPEIDEAEIDWWEILGSLKWGIMCMIMYEAFRSGADPSVERATIGRRVSETEIDLVNLLEKV